MDTPIHPVRLGKTTLPANLLAAPVAGYTDLFFRDQVRRFGGAGLLYTEMLSADMVVRVENGKTPRRLAGVSDETARSEIPVAVQLWDDDPDVLLAAAEHVVTHYKPALIGLNFGCPVSRVTRHESGAWLLDHPGRLGRIVNTLAKRLPVPVSAKIRLGFSSGRDTAMDVLKAVEDAGGAMLTVHGRFADMRMKGACNWDRIAEIKQAAHIPVIGNGDLTQSAEILGAIRRYGVDGVMLARALIRAPWLFRDATALAAGRPIPPAPVACELKDMLIAHFHHLVMWDGEKDACKRIRGFAMKYARGLSGVRHFRKHIAEVRDATQFMEVIERFFPSENPVFE